jgi:hypothetical protein
MIVKFRHSGNIGDIIYSIPCVRSMLRTISEGNPPALRDQGGVKAKWLLHTDIPANYIPGSNHPCGNVRMTKGFADNMRKLLECQTWVDSVEVAPFFHRKEIDIDLDEMRSINMTMDKGSITDYYAWTFGVQYDDITYPWISIPEYAEKLGEFVIVGRSSRYRSPLVTYSFLRDYELVGFVGLDSEYEDFRSCCPHAKHIKTNSFLVLASVISSARMFIGNQSFPYALAEALKTPRLLEVSPVCPNVRQYGRYAYGALHENVMKDYFSVLLDVTEKSQENVRLAKTLADMFPGPVLYKGTPFDM